MSDDEKDELAILKFLDKHHTDEFSASEIKDNLKDELATEDVAKFISNQFIFQNRCVDRNDRSAKVRINSSGRVRFRRLAELENRESNIDNSSHINIHGSVIGSNVTQSSLLEESSLKASNNKSKPTIKSIMESKIKLITAIILLLTAIGAFYKGCM